MSAHAHLSSTQLLDCEGRATHTLTLLVDGSVQIEAPAYTCVVDPARRAVVRPGGVRVPSELFDIAATLARELA
ncbi:MAG: hypothetical protein S0880_18825 [Actinomycetota bacterium]|nr:hypothetical protein [Actinomycetota bacterium]